MSSLEIFEVDVIVFEWFMEGWFEVLKGSSRGIHFESVGQVTPNTRGQGG